MDAPATPPVETPVAPAPPIESSSTVAPAPPVDATTAPEQAPVLTAKIADVAQIPTAGQAQSAPVPAQAAPEPKKIKKPRDNTELAIAATVVIVVSLAALIVLAFVMTTKK